MEYNKRMKDGGVEESGKVIEQAAIFVCHVTVTSIPVTYPLPLDRGTSLPNFQWGDYPIEKQRCPDP